MTAFNDFIRKNGVSEDWKENMSTLYRIEIDIRLDNPTRVDAGLKEQHFRRF
jgi:hypothetical protein